MTNVIGPNNSNKTYIAYSIYGLWEGINNNSSNSSRLRRTAWEMTNRESSIQAQNEHNGVWSLKIDEPFYDVFIEIIKDIGKQFSKYHLESFFQDSSRKIFNKATLEIEVSKNDIKKGINQLLNKKLSHFVISKVEQNNDHLSLHLNEDINTLYLNENINNDSFSQNIVFTVVSLVIENIFSDILPLPAERNAFINTYKMLANRRYKIQGKRKKKGNKKC